MLLLDAEDIVSSLDFQSIYLKVKSKIGSASVQHYERLPLVSHLSLLIHQIVIVGWVRAPNGNLVHFPAS